MARLFVDGLNVLRRDPELRTLERRDPAAARAELIRLLGHGTLARFEVVVVFDGPALPGAVGGKRQPGSRRVNVRYAGAETADALIAALATSRDTIATDDRALARETLDTGPAVWSVPQLLARIRPATRRSGRASAPGVDESEEKPRAYPALRRFPVCARCMWSRRDDGLLLCEEDSAHNAPLNFREGW